MKNKQGNVTVIVLIIVIVAITASVITWIVATKMQTPTPQVATTQPVVQTPQQTSVTSVPTSQPIQSNAPTPQTTQSDNSWKLIHGDRKNSCTGLAYEGNQNISGYYAFRENYGEREWLFITKEDDLNKFPIPTKYEDGRDGNEAVKIIDATPELLAKLKGSTKENPVEITIKGYYLYCEGVPVVSIAPARQAFAKYLK